MNPVIALVGRPNVGKSTLFNMLTQTRDALVADYPGLTRDRQYGLGKTQNWQYLVVDTGGLSGEKEGVDTHMAAQSLQAVEEADVVLLMVDGRDGIMAADENIVQQLRNTGKKIVLVVNKTEGLDSVQAAADFYALGLGTPLLIAASHGRGIAQMMEEVLTDFPQNLDLDETQEEADKGIRIAFVGRPNVGKSTLVNRILGEERVVAFDQPGTTRDSIEVPFERDGQRYVLIDTAGVRRRARVKETIEKFSIIKALQAVDSAHVVVMVLDAGEGITEQDAHLLGLVLDAGRALILTINKWDGLSIDQRDKIRRDLELRLNFIDFAEQRFISALHGTGVGELFALIKRAYESATINMTTSRLTELLELAVQAHQPPLVHGRRIKLRYAHQGGANPPVIVIHGNQTARLPGAYKRYLMNYFRDALRLVGTPVRLELKTGTNPFAGRRTTLTPRQLHKRELERRQRKKN